ncbi:ATP-dependent zinc metalloprotease FtsH [bacterium]|nr:ATP-dependent zinc metalloprotease FtsH [bacterium]
MPKKKQIIIWFAIIIVVILIANAFQDQQAGKLELSYTEFLDKVDEMGIDDITIQENKIFGVLKSSGKKFVCNIPNDPDLIKLLRTKKINITVQPPEEPSMFLKFLWNYFPIIAVIALWIFLMRQMQGGGNRALSFGKSRARLMQQSKKVTFNDVAGVDEAKEELAEIIEFLREPQKFQKLGGKIPKGVLLVGSPGTGKTLLARAIAGEAEVAFFSISGSDFVEMFVGVGASRVRDLFHQAKTKAPCIVFMDEIDAVGRHRGAGLGGGHDEREQTLNQLLVEMDGFETNDGVILIAATNRPDVLDPALLRPGRFDRLVVVSRPDVKGREGILMVHSKDIPLHEDVKLSVIARGTPGFSGADLANLVNEAALLAARKEKTTVDMDDFESAKDKVLMGVERKSLLLTEEEKKNTAIHEAGHALIARLLPYADPIHKVTIIPRGMALGATFQLPIDDKHNYSKKYLMDQIAVCLGGRVAEELLIGDLTNGAGNDLEKATDIARKMVCEWGMSEELGPMTFGKNEEEIFLGRDFAVQKNFSEDTAIKIDKAITEIITSNYKRVRNHLTEQIETLKRLSENLLEKEVLDANDIEAIVNPPKTPPPPLEQIPAQA